MNVGVITPFPDDCCSWYRGWGPWTDLRREADINLVSYPGWGWVEIMQCDVLFIHRPWHQMHGNMIQMAKNLGVRVWLDFDDDLLNIPFWHPAATSHGDKFRSFLTSTVEMADVITVSTEPIGRSLELIAPGVNWCIIPNAWDDRVKIGRQLPDSQSSTISWRGGKSGSHTQDLGIVLPAIQRVAERFHRLNFAFMGQSHWDVLPMLSEQRVRLFGQNDFLPYLAQLCALRPMVHIVPLADTPFNRAKSNCAWLEATAAGAAVVAPGWPEWTKPGVATYSNPVNFEDALTEAVTGDARANNLASREYVADYLRLEVVNRQRLKILESLR